MVNHQAALPSLLTPVTSGLFGDDDLVLPGYSTEVLFASHRWDLSPAGFAANTKPGDRVLNLGRFLEPVRVASGPGGESYTIDLSPVWLVRAKEVVAILLAPNRTTSRGRIDAYQVRPAAPSTAKGHYSRLYALAKWATLEALPPDLSRWEQDDLDDFLAFLATDHPNPGSGADGIDPPSVYGYINTIRVLWLLRDVLTHGGFTFEPWDGRKADDIAGGDVTTLRTSPIPQEQYQPLMRDTWFVIDTIGADLAEAIRCRDEIFATPRLPWWGHLNTFTNPADMANAEVVLVHTNAASAVLAMRNVVVANPDIVIAGGADLQRRFGISAPWFAANRDLLLDYGIIEKTRPQHLAGGCTVPGCPRDRARRHWCETHASEWAAKGCSDAAAWTKAQTALPSARPCAVPSCPRDARGRFCAGHDQRWNTAGRPGPGAWAVSDDAAVPVGGWHYRWTGRFPQVRSVADHLTIWLTDPNRRIPMRADGPLATHLKNKLGGVLEGDPVDFDLLAAKLRVSTDTLRPDRIRALVNDAVDRGQTEIGGLGPPSTVAWADRTQRPWIEGIDRNLIAPLTHLCRMAAVVFIYMFSGMRDSEVQSLKKGCVEPFWGHLTLTGKEFKTFRGGQARWIVIEPVAQAARLAETLTWHDERIVVPARPGTEPVLNSGPEIDGLITTLNTAARIGLLEPIPAGAPIRPHRFRRTFAITARTSPWMDIALQWQFKHASHYMTQSYYALNDDVTAEHNEIGKELVEAAVDRLAELYTHHHDGEPLYGRAANRLVHEFDTITADIDTNDRDAGFPGKTWRHSELRKRLRGSALNLHPGLAVDCAFGPGGACGGVEAPNWNACDPQCVNVVLDRTQLGFLNDTAERISGYLDDDRLGHTSRLILQRQLHDLRAAVTAHQASPTLGAEGDR